MILGLPIDTWVLIVVATLPGFLLVFRAYTVHKGDSGQVGEERSPGNHDG